MKTIITLALAAVTLFACKKQENKSQDVTNSKQISQSEMMNHDPNMANDSAMMTNEVMAKNIPSNANKKSITSEEKNTKIVLTPLLNSYLKLKNALANDNANAAATLANEMKSSLTDLKKSTVPTDKAQMFNEVITDLAEHASHINSKSDDIEHQREHFVLISKDIYQLTKEFGAGKTIYKEFCHV